jgi:hypothetical protein
MSAMRNTVVLTAAAALLSSCLKEELPVPRTPRGNVVEAEACVGASYEDQVWFDISSNSITARNSKMDWDLAFAGDASGWVIRLNGARFMRAKATEQTDITLATDTTGFGPSWRVDHNEGSEDSLALGDWRDDDAVYVIDLGNTVFGLPMGLRKLQIVSSDVSGYAFRVAQLDGSGVQEFTVGKDPSRAYVHFNLRAGQPITIAPPDGQYDIVFTQYTYQFYDPYMAYLVTGAVSGFSGLRVAELITNDFAAVSLADTVQHPFSGKEDAVGYDWKEYSFETSSYVIYPDHVFIVQDREGYFFKLHFTDFYNDQGQRGCPQFEVVAL